MSHAGADLDAGPAARLKTVTVIVLNWNGLADTRVLLPTLARSRLPQGWRLHVMVVDNGSTDGSAAALAREFPGVELLALGENLRFAGGNNAGLRRALERGDDAVVLLNNDTEADPGMLEHLLLALEQAPWGFDQLAEVEQWLEDLTPVLAEQTHPETQTVSR